MYIKVCTGCCNKYPKPEYTQVSKYRFGDVYYHFNSSCVKLHSSVCSPSLANTTDPQAHKEILQCHVSIFLTDALTS